MRRLFTLFLIGFIFICSNTKANETEPNNTPAKANRLALTSSNSGALNAAGDIDWWKVTTTADGKLTITLNNTGNPDLKVVSLYDTAGAILLSSSDVGNGIGGTSADGLAAGTYYIKINGSSGNETGAYTIADTLVSPVQPNDIEPNDQLTQALRLTLNNTTTGHVGYYYNNQRDTTDWYKVTTTADGMLKIIFDNTSNQNDLKVISLYDTAGTILSNRSNVGNGIGGINTDGLAAGTYYIKINGSGGMNTDLTPSLIV